DIEGGASAVSLLQGPVAHVKLQAEHNAMVWDLCIEVILGLRTLILGEHGERRGRKPPLALHAPRPGLETNRRLAEVKVHVAVGIHHRAFYQEVRVDEVTASAADEPGVDAVKAMIDRTKRSVVAALGIEGELVPVPLRLSTDHAMALRPRKAERGAIARVAHP